MTYNEKQQENERWT